MYVLDCCHPRRNIFIIFSNRKKKEKKGECMHWIDFEANQNINWSLWETFFCVCYIFIFVCGLEPHGGPNFFQIRNPNRFEVNILGQKSSKRIVIQDVNFNMSFNPEEQREKKNKIWWNIFAILWYIENFDCFSYWPGGMFNVHIPVCVLVLLKGDFFFEEKTKKK